jgi:hypothetical protein
MIVSYFPNEVVHLLGDTRGLALYSGSLPVVPDTVASYFPNEVVHLLGDTRGLTLHSGWISYSTTDGSLPVVPNTVQYHVGIFSDNLPQCLETHFGLPNRLINIDCDVYSSTAEMRRLHSGRSACTNRSKCM